MGLVNIGITFRLERWIWSNLFQHNRQAGIFFNNVVPVTWSRSAYHDVISWILMWSVLALKSPTRLKLSRLYVYTSRVLWSHDKHYIALISRHVWCWNHALWLMFSNQIWVHEKYVAYASLEAMISPQSRRLLRLWSIYSIKCDTTLQRLRACLELFFLEVLYKWRASNRFYKRCKKWHDCALKIESLHHFWGTLIGTSLKLQKLGRAKDYEFSAHI